MLEGYRLVVRDHVYDKCWELDITWAELERLLDGGEVIEEQRTDDEGKRVVLVLGWRRPLHVVYRADPETRLAGFLTV